MATPTAGRIRRLQALLQAEGFDLRLYINKRTPAASDVANDYTQPSGAGYAAKTGFASGTFTRSGTLNSGADIRKITGLSSTSDLYVGQRLTGTGIPSDTFVVTVGPTAGEITIDKDATTTGAQTLTFHRWTVKDVSGVVQGQYQEQRFEFTGAMTAAVSARSGTFNLATDPQLVTITTTDIIIGHRVTGTGVPAGTYVSAIGTGTITLSADIAAGTSSPQNFTFTPQIWGSYIVGSGGDLIQSFPEATPWYPEGSGDHCDPTLKINLTDAGA